MSRTPEHILKMIQEAKERELTRFDLSAYYLTALPESLGELQGLTQLDLINNRLTELPDWMSELQGLTRLYLTYSEILSRIASMRFSVGESLSKWSMCLD